MSHTQRAELHPAVRGEIDENPGPDLRKPELAAHGFEHDRIASSFKGYVSRRQPLQPAGDSLVSRAPDVA